MFPEKSVAPEVLKEINPITSRFHITVSNPIVDSEIAEFLDAISSSDRAAHLFFDIHRIEILLRIALQDVDCIGNLAISRETNDWFGQLLRNSYLRGHRIALQSSKQPAMFITTMVFSARYSDSNERNFWTPYLTRIWHIPKENSQAAYEMCRRYFFQAKIFLAQALGLDFPIYQDGDVVRPINYHAIIPYYLQDDFGKWTISVLEQFPFANKSTSEEDIREATHKWLHYRNQSIEKLAPTLRYFVRGVDISGKPLPETAKQARLLFKNMLRAFELFQQGENAETIAQILPNQIERQLWQQIQQALIFREEQQSRTRKRRSTIGWIWELDTEQLLLRLMNVDLTSEPEVCIWASQDASLTGIDAIHADITPWKTREGWLIDNLLIPAGDPKGRLYILSKDHDLENLETPLFAIDVPPLPQHDFTIYRLTQQNYYAVPVPEDDYDHGLNDGNYIVSLKDGLSILNSSGEHIHPIEHHDIPQVLREQLKHTSASTYQLVFPIKIVQSGHLVAQIFPKRNGLSQPELTGDAKLTNLSRSIPPVFLSRDIDLIIPQIPERISHVVLTLTSAASTPPIVKKLDELIRLGIAVISHTSIRVQVGKLVREEFALHLINLRQDLTSLLAAPLEFIYLANIQIEGIDPNVIYTPQHPPVISLSNVTTTQIRVDSETEISESDKGIKIQWQDLRQNECQLHLLLNDQHIPLIWQIKRVFASIEINGRTTSVVYETDFDGASIHVRGLPNMWLEWSVGGQKRSFHLDAHGEYDRPLQRDALLDALREQQDTALDLEITGNGDQWSVARFVRQPEIKNVTLNYDEQDRRLDIRFEVGSIRSGAFSLSVHTLSQPNNSFILGSVDDLSKSIRFDLDLPPGQYRLELTSDEIPVTLDSFADSFTVSAPTKLQSLTVIDEHTFFGALLLPAQQLASRTTSAEAQEWVRAILAVHDNSRWAQWQVNLPSWAVVPGRLVMTMLHFRYKLSVIPERAALRGKAGIGRAVLKLDGENRTTTYIKWRPQFDQSHSVRLYICVPSVEPATPYYLLDEYDLWPVYICEKCGGFVGSRGGYARFSPRIWIDHRHGQLKPTFRDVAYETRTSFELGANVSMEKDHLVSLEAKQLAGNFQVEAILNYFGESDDTFDSELLPASPSFFRQALERDLPAVPIFPATWDLRKRAVNQWLTKASANNDFPAAGAFVRILTALEGRDDLSIVADMLLLAFLLRIQAESERQAQALHQSIGVQLRDLQPLTDAVAQQTPHLFIWAITWAELLLVHAAC